MTRRRSSYRSLASLQRDLSVCRACVEAGYPLESLPVRNLQFGQRAYMYGQAPGPKEGVERRPWRGDAGKRLREWLRLEEDTFYGTFYCASVTRCFPGKQKGGADRVPSRPEQDLCVFWRDRELEILRPELIVPVGGLAIWHLLGIKGLDACIGCVYERNGTQLIPLPHPSNASTWWKKNPGQTERAAALVRDAVARLQG